MTPNYQGGMTSNVVHLSCKACYLNYNFLIVQLDPFTFIIMKADKIAFKISPFFFHRRTKHKFEMI